MTLVGPKIGYKYDTRNRRINTENGEYLKVQFKLLGHHLVSEFDARFFMPVNDHVFASRIFMALFQVQMFRMFYSIN